MAQMLSNDLQRRYTFIHELAFQVLRTCCCYGTYISSKTPKSSPHIAYVQTHPLPPTKEKGRGGSQVVSMVIPLVENTIVSNEKAEGKATKRLGSEGKDPRFGQIWRLSFPHQHKMSLFACTNCNGRHPFDQLSKGDQLCKVNDVLRTFWLLE